MFKVNNKDTLAIGHWRRSGILLLTLNIFHTCSGVSIVLPAGRTSKTIFLDTSTCIILRHEV